jgi:hypothetical protein
VIMALTGLELELLVINAPIVPEPFALRPMDGAEFNQEYAVPVPVNGNAAVEDPLHTIWSGKSFTTGVGLIVMVKVCVAPEQPTEPPVKSGVTVSVAMTGAVSPLIAVNEGILPTPANGIPMDEVLLVQE